MTLRDFQKTLAEKVQRAGEAGTATSMLGFESGGECWLVDLADAGEVLPVPALSDVPLTKHWFRGLANIRGKLYSVTDLAAFHGNEPTPLKAQARLLLTGARFGSNLALLLSATQGLKPLPALEAMPGDRLAPAQPWRGERYRDSAGRTWTHLLLPVLLNSSEFLDIAA